ncbi:MAG: hypothetical protein ACXAEU_22880 [Candidatus Hodarchaeales archaeon]|jgi:hypothetical protein
MALNSKIRRNITLVIIIVVICSFLILQITIEIEGIVGDVNPKDIYLFQENYTSFYRYENGSKDIRQELILKSNVLNATHTNVSIEYGNNNEWFLAHPNGTVYQDGVLQGNYSFWWIYVPNHFMMFGVKGGEEYSVIDPTGFLGAENNSYDLIITRKRVYWPTDMELTGLSGAQSSFDIDLYDRETKRLISQATLDITCGIIEVWEGSQTGFVHLTLKNTNFPISRNRIVGILVEMILGIIVVILSFLLMSKKWDNKFLSRFTQERDVNIEITLLLIAGIIAIVIEMIDIWFYIYLGFWGNMGLHAAYTILLGLICWKQKYKYQWLVPAILEIAFVFSLNFVTGDPYVPPLTAFMGSLISWIAIVWASGIEKYSD